MKQRSILAIIVILFITAACGEKTSVVESGTYQGTIHEVEADKNEIYVKTADGKLLELYFTKTTTLTRNGATIPFSELAFGKKVSVEVKKAGQRLDPIAVEILE